MTLLWIIYLLCSVFIALGLAGSIYILKTILRLRATRSWPSVQARLLQCDIEPQDGEKESLALRYSYSVGGVPYTGAAVRPYYDVGVHEVGPLFEKLKGCEAVLARYNPYNPAEACLVVGSFRTDWAAFYGALLFFSAGILFMLAFHFLWVGLADYAAAVTIIQ